MTNNPHPIGEDDLQAFIDGRLSDERQREVEAYFGDHPEQAGQVGRDVEIRNAMRAALQGKAQEAIPQKLRVAALERRMRSRRPAWRSIAAGVVLFVAGTAAGWLVRGIGVPDAANGDGAVVSEAANAHLVFAADRNRPVEIRADEAERLSRWLSKRVGLPVRIADLTPLGYQLLGGRLLASEDGPAGQLMYEDAQKKRLSVYMRATRSDSTAFRFVDADPVSAFYWVDDGLSYAVSAEAGRDVLFEAANAVFDAAHGQAPDG
ncbi:MAG TPA: anti-sigma factor [Afifellaceae bacterium]|nr:anti-sigma factor [Afifellaceae bacterium]